MTGHVRRRGERSWELKFDVGTDAAGNRKTRYASFRGTKREAQIELARLITAAAAGESVDPSRMTVGDFLDQWQRTWCGANLSPKSAERHDDLIRLHIKPRIGSTKLQKLRPVHLTELYGALQREAGLAPRTIGHVHRTLHRALGQGVTWDLLTSNVASRVAPPRVPQEEIQILTAAEIKAFLHQARNRPIYPIAALGLATGMRRGELLALRWQDIDLDRAKITVARSLEQTKAGLRFKEPKTKRGRRTITLPPSAVTDIRAHWKVQQELRLALGAGKAPPEALVFSGIDGEPRRPNAVTKEWERTVKAAGATHATFHSLRHTHASHLIAAGVDILTISRRLGHASPTTTLTVYGHLFPQTDDKAAQAIEAALSAASTD
ncbi:site-specific integrase [Rhodopseudomonas palustris]|uniref:Site-specific integrase n=1 Tax=Rhodopseudomonas palustris TaxID=1076 RepID=A0AAX3DRF3_RHOPL|nr:site-specific integrase [Rhodopseudomonas palustris]UYO37482.1 site-specific integrase [Rhodopseudomonas palustris]